MGLTEQALFDRIWHSCFPLLSLLLLRKVDSAVDASLGGRRGLHFLPAYKTRLHKDVICSKVNFFFLSYLASTVQLKQTSTAIQMKPHLWAKNVRNGQSYAEDPFFAHRCLRLHPEQQQQHVDCNPVSLVKSYSPRGCWAFRGSHVQRGEPLRRSVLNINHNKRRIPAFYPPVSLFLILWGCYHAGNWKVWIENQGGKKITLSSCLCLGAMMMMLLFQPAQIRSFSAAWQESPFVAKWTLRLELCSSLGEQWVRWKDSNKE